MADERRGNLGLRIDRFALERLSRLVTRVYIPVLICIGVVWGLAEIDGLERWELFTDPVEDKASVLFGALSQAGIFAWAVGATACFMAAWLLRGDPDRERRRRMFLTAGLLTSYFALDDAYLIHEEVFPDLSVPEGVGLALYGLVFVAFLWAYRVELLDSSRFLVVGAALALFATSALIDAVPADLPGHGTVEDLAKLLGAVSWAAYFVGRTMDAIVQRFSTSSGV